MLKHVELAESGEVVVAQSACFRSILLRPGTIIMQSLPPYNEFEMRQPLELRASPGPAGTYVLTLGPEQGVPAGQYVVYRSDVDGMPVRVLHRCGHQASHIMYGTSGRHTLTRQRQELLRHVCPDCGEM